MAQEDFNINNIYSNLNRVGGLLNPCNFLMVITPPKWLRNFNYRRDDSIPTDKQQSIVQNQVINNIPFFCFATQLPGINVQTTSIRRHGYGIVEKRPVDLHFPDVWASFMCDAEGNIINFFNAWVQNIVNFEDSIGMRRSVNGAEAFEFQYPDNYETVIDIYQYNPIGNEVVVYTLKNAFPNVVSEIPLDWDASNTYESLNVNFKYKTWSSKALNPGTMEVTSLTYRNLLSDPIAAAIYAYNNIKSPRLLADFIATELKSLAYVPLRGGIGLNLLTQNITGIL